MYVCIENITITSYFSRVPYAAVAYQNLQPLYTPLADPPPDPPPDQPPDQPGPPVDQPDQRPDPPADRGPCVVIRTTSAGCGLGGVTAPPPSTTDT